MGAAANAAALKRAGTVSVIQAGPSAGFSFGSTTGTSRVVWIAGNSLPRVQCVRVKRAGGLFQSTQPCRSADRPRESDRH